MGCNGCWRILLNWIDNKNPHLEKRNELKRKLWVGWRKKKILVLGVGWEERRGEEKKGNRVGKTSTLPYTDLESFFRESLDIIAKVLLQIISYMLFQHLVLSPVVLCSGTIERKEKKHNKTPTTSSSSAVQKIHISSSSSSSWRRWCRKRETNQTNPNKLHKTKPQEFPPPPIQIQQQNGTQIYQGCKPLLFLARRRVRVLLGRDTGHTRKDAAAAVLPCRHGNRTVTAQRPHGSGMVTAR